MTEFWVSGKNKWCEYCHCWLKDTAASWAVHERGMGHQDAVARKLRMMRQTADREKKEEVELASSMSKVEAEAKKQYDADQKAAEAHRKATLGEWVWSSEAGYYYNAVHRWYYDTNTSMYYGGDPVEWTDAPPLPHAARYEVMNKPPPAPAAAAAAGRPAAGKQQQQHYAVAGSRITNKHPLSQVGGYQLHSLQGSIGGAKGVGSTAAAGSADAGKRKRGEGAAATAAAGGSSKPLSKEEVEFAARREAARQRVQQRSMATFGLS